METEAERPLFCYYVRFQRRVVAPAVYSLGDSFFSEKNAPTVMTRAKMII